MQKLLQKITQGSLVKQIMVGLVAGIIVALVSPATASAVGLLGALFVKEQAADATCFVTVFDKEIVVAPLFVFGVDLPEPLRRD